MQIHADGIMQVNGVGAVEVAAKLSVKTACNKEHDRPEHKQDSANDGADEIENFQRCHTFLLPDQCPIAIERMNASPRLTH
jgi:hypothetical protein